MKTALYDQHVALGAKIVSFAGWEMPLSYKGIVAEHQAVRNAVGLFDVSHMGQIWVHGQEAESFISDILTNDILEKENGSATYGVMCHENGGSVDDVIVYKKDSYNYFIVVNASNRDKDLQHLLDYAKNRQVNIQPRFETDGILALQGPRAEELLDQFFPEIHKLKTMHFLEVKEESGQNLIISKTGYTGAGGLELYGSNDLIKKWWDKLLLKGKTLGIEPVGLGARDTLRLEMGFALYGHELSDSISPNESVAAWTIKWNKNFVGKQFLLNLEKSPNKRHAYGIRLIDKGIAREGYSVYKNDKNIGVVTSGSFSPTLNQSIALILVSKELNLGDVVEIEIRQQKCKAEVTKLPFIRKQTG